MGQGRRRASQRLLPFLPSLLRELPSRSLANEAFFNLRLASISRPFRLSDFVSMLRFRLSSSIFRPFFPEVGSLPRLAGFGGASSVSNRRRGACDVGSRDADGSKSSVIVMIAVVSSSTKSTTSSRGPVSSSAASSSFSSA